MDYAQTTVCRAIDDGSHACTVLLSGMRRYGACAQAISFAGLMRRRAARVAGASEGAGIGKFIELTEGSAADPDFWSKVAPASARVGFDVVDMGDPC